MLRNKPRIGYCGLTVVLSNKSRFDSEWVDRNTGEIRGNLLTSTGGKLFNQHCLNPEYNSMLCDVRLADDLSPWHPDTKCVLLLGEYAMHKWDSTTRNNTLNEMRGSPLTVRDNIPAYASFFPQDAADIQSYEQEYNEDSKEYNHNEAETNDEDEGDVKRFSNTKRSNYAFWLKADVGKCKRVLKGDYKRDNSDKQVNYRLYPTSSEVIKILSETKGTYLDFDTETDCEEQNLLCFSFTFDGINVYCVPVLDYNYKWAYGNLHLILKALSIAIKNNILVAHNGAGFDFLVLAMKYGIPIYETYDTMIAQHRIFPDIGKSLGHVMSFWLDVVFHKDTDSRAYFTREHMMQKLLYCGKDVIGMRGVRLKQQAFASRVPGLSDSIRVAMRSIRPYLISTLQGIRYDAELMKEKINLNDRLMIQYLRMINLLIGESGMAEVRKCLKGKPKSSFPSSNKQCVEYFHNILGYNIVRRNPPDQNGVRNVSLAKKAMLKLRLKYENPVIDLCNVYRYTRLETTTPMGFKPWKDDNNKIIKPENNTEKV